MLPKLFPSLTPHPDFPDGATVRVRSGLKTSTAPERRAMMGRVGKVVHSRRAAVKVEFDLSTGPVRMDFIPGQLERLT